MGKRRNKNASSNKGGEALSSTNKGGEASSSVLAPKNPIGKKQSSSSQKHTAPVKFAHELLDALNLKAIPGNGNTSSIFETRVVIKVYKKDVQHERQFEVEKNALTILKHKYIVNMYGYIDNTEGEGKMAGEDKKKKSKGKASNNEEEMETGEDKRKNKVKAIVLEYLTSDLEKELASLTWKDSVKVLRQLAEVVSYIHGQGDFIHQDLKPANILIDEVNDIKIADFGAFLEKAAISEFSTPTYTSPESLKAGEKITQKSDVYSYGVIIMAVMGKEDDVGATAQRVALTGDKGKADFYPNIVDRIERSRDRFKEISSYLKNSEGFNREIALGFLKIALLCTCIQPTKRPTMAEVAEKIEGLFA